MTAYEKLAISLPSRAAEHVRRAVRQGKATSVSAYIAAAVEERAKRESLDDLLEDMLVESGGPMSAAERRAAERKLGITNPRTRPRRSRR